MTTTESQPKYSQANIDQIHKRTLWVLMVGVLPSGAGMAAAYSSAAILGKELTGSDSLGSLAAACMSVGGTLASVPLAAYVSTRGRRAGLQAGWAFASVGSILALVAAVTRFYPLLPIGMIGVGVGNATNLSARFAAADLATEETRGRSIGTLSWAKTFGSALGPTMGLGGAAYVARMVGVPAASGTFVFAFVMFVFASTAMFVLLRPDPLEVAGGIQPRDTSGRSPLAQTGEHFGQAIGAIKIIRSIPAARFAVYAMVVGQGVMAAIMVATPLHMRAGVQTLTVVGIVISIHIIGMYFFSPVVGFLTDKVGPTPMIGLGGLLSAGGALIDAFSPEDNRDGVLIGLFLIGLGWSFGLVAGSALLTSSVGIGVRTRVQGSADLLMTGSGAIASLSAGVIYQFLGYRELGLVGVAFALTLTAYAVVRSLGGCSPRPSPSPVP